MKDDLTRTLRDTKAYQHFGHYCDDDFFFLGGNKISRLERVGPEEKNITTRKLLLKTHKHR